MPRNSPPGVIRPEEIYGIREFMARAGIGDYAFRQLRRDGLKVVAIGKKRFVIGRDFVDFVDRAAESGGGVDDLDTAKNPNPQ